jgi:hypothetical protein
MDILVNKAWPMALEAIVIVAGTEIVKHLGRGDG